MSVLRNDQNLSTADIVNAENNAETRAENRGMGQPDGNLQPQQGAAVAERERVQGSAAGAEFPDLSDRTDPRMAARTADPGLEHKMERDQVERDTRPVRPVAAFRPDAAESDAAAYTNQEANKNTTADTNKLSSGPLFPEDELHNFRAQWDRVQASFVDEPRQAVQQADSLVANVVKRIAEQFAEERSRLEQQWDRGDDVSTEDLRQGLRRYRAFFDRLLSF